MLENKMTYDNIFQTERLLILILRDQTAEIINSFKYLAAHRDVMATRWDVKGGSDTPNTVWNFNEGFETKQTHDVKLNIQHKEWKFVVIEERRYQKI